MFNESPNSKKKLNQIDEHKVYLYGRWSNFGRNQLVNLKKLIFFLFSKDNSERDGEWNEGGESWRRGGIGVVVYGCCCMRCKRTWLVFGFLWFGVALLRKTSVLCSGHLVWASGIWCCCWMEIFIRSFSLTSILSLLGYRGNILLSDGIRI